MSRTELSPSSSSSSASASPSPPSASPSPPPPAPRRPPPSGPQRLFQEAVRSGNTAAVQSVLQGLSSCEFNVNSFGPEGQTALHQSVIEGNLELVKLLVKFGADVRLANRDGWSALHIAAFGGHQDIVLYLVTRAKFPQHHQHQAPGAPQGAGAGAGDTGRSQAAGAPR